MLVGVVYGPCFVIQYLVCNTLVDEERTSCVTLIVSYSRVTASVIYLFLAVLQVDL